MQLRSFESDTSSDAAPFQTSFARLPKTAAEPRAAPRQLQHVNFYCSDKITGYLSYLSGLKPLGWTPLGQSGLALGFGRVSWSAWSKHLFYGRRAPRLAEAAANCELLSQQQDHRRPIRPEGSDAAGLDAVGSEWVGSWGMLGVLERLVEASFLGAVEYSEATAAAH